MKGKVYDFLCGCEFPLWVNSGNCGLGAIDHLFETGAVRSYRNAVNCCRVRNDRLYITQICANRDGTCTFARAVSTERDKAFAGQVSDADLAKSFLEGVQAEDLGPLVALANLFHIGEMKIDEVSEGGWVASGGRSRGFVAINPAFAIKGPFLGNLVSPESLADVPAFAADLYPPIAGRKPENSGQDVLFLCSKRSNQSVFGRSWVHTVVHKFPFNSLNIKGKALTGQGKKICVAPMMDWTDTHCRVLHRLLTARALLYTEMVTAEAILHGDRARLLGFDASEHPVALQLGGSEPVRLAEAARVAEGFGYDEINLNVGCPSDRVQSGRFGACLMREPQLVAECVKAMRGAVSIPVTVKCRIGVDDQEPEVALGALIRACADAGINSFAVHARKAWLEGLSPKENRDVPPLDYDLVARVKQKNRALEIVLNGGIQSLDEAEAHLSCFDGVMLGRAAYQNPAILLDVDQRFFGAPARDLDAVIEGYCDYVERKLAEGVRLHSMTKHMLGLFNGRPGARAFRRHLSENASRDGAGIGVLREALTFLNPERQAA